MQKYPTLGNYRIATQRRHDYENFPNFANMRTAVVSLCATQANLQNIIIGPMAGKTNLGGSSAVRYLE